MALAFLGLFCFVRLRVGPVSYICRTAHLSRKSRNSERSHLACVPDNDVTGAVAAFDHNKHSVSDLIAIYVL